jgi:vacuolar-type H+-ATPase subunit E/Vma4
LGIAELRTAIVQQAEERVAAMRRDADEQSARLREETLAEVARRDAARLERERAALSRETDAQLARFRQAARGRVLEARASLLDRVFAAARRSLRDDPACSLTSAELSSRLERALAQLPAGAATIACSPCTASAALALLADRADVSVEVDSELSPGFRAIGADARLVIDASASALLEQQRDELAIEVLRRLHEGDAA